MSRVEDDESVCCPALDAAASWDNLASLRGPILSLPRLAEHAGELARAHGVPTLSGHSRLVEQRFQQTRESLGQAYQVLSRDVRAVREPTPAEEWLLDNAHVVEDQLREVAVDLPRGYLDKLPRLAEGPLAAAPRVYALCLDYLRHSDARVESESLIVYVQGYQRVHPLTIGELWAVPIMLRIGLLMMVSSVAREAVEDSAAQEAFDLAEELLDSEQPAELLSRVPAVQVAPSFLVELRRAVLDHEGENSAVLAWIHERARGLETSFEELSRLHHLRRAEDQVTVGNAITSMRTISAYDWSRFFDTTSLSEAILAADPGGSYPASDARTRDRVRHAVERLARKNKLDERDVANTAVRLARQASLYESHDPAEGHAAYYLIDRGRPALETALEADPPLYDRFVRFLCKHASPYFLTILFLTLLLEDWLAAWLRELGATSFARVALLLLLAVPLSEIAIGLCNTLVTALVPPRVLPKLDFKQGIPADCRTLVVVPALLDSPETLARLLSDLEIRALANMEEQLYFALLTDFCDCTDCVHAEGLLEAAVQGIAELNLRHPHGPHERFHLLHRKRVYNGTEGCFMGWERKRGKLEELNRLIIGQGEHSFEICTARADFLCGVRYVITLDTDTELPRGTARKLVAAMAHPLNRPRFDATLGRVTSGHGIIQPRVGTTPRSSRRSRYARWCAGAPGIDPYTSAVSDVYQDLFGEGSFVGKGIYDVRVFAEALAGKVPENSLLSHDLFEGLFARSALASDIEVLDDQPASYGVEARRQHRWMRGDYQLLPWLFGRMGVKLSLLGCWKICDNLRRALLAPSLMCATLIVLIGAPRAAGLLLVTTLTVAFCPVFVRLVANLTRKQTEGSLVRWPVAFGDFRMNSVRALLSLLYLLDTALLALDAIGRTLYRLTISHRKLLEWTSTGQAERLFRERGLKVEPRMLAGSVAAALALLFVSLHGGSRLLWLAPLCLAWVSAPVLTLWLTRAVPDAVHTKLPESQRTYARRIARKTWRFFETFVTAEDHWLPPDNYQEDPRGVLARRTSPTNIGLYLLSCLSARDLGYVTLREFVDRIAATLDAIDELEKFRGHLLNWYDTATLGTLAPKYVSMVDSGNLLGHLWTLRQGCHELIEQPITLAPCLDAIEDALRLAKESGAQTESFLSELARCRSVEAGLPAALSALRELASHLPAVPDSERVLNESAYWLSEARTCALSWLSELEALLPFARALASAPKSLHSDDIFAHWSSKLAHADTLLVLRDVSAEARTALHALADTLSDREAHAYLTACLLELERAHQTATELVQRLTREAERCGSVADRMDFTFMYDRERSLFSIGYNVDLGRSDGSRYDLLASEARLGSFVAIAKGDVPEEHWFHLSRTRVRVGARASLVAWSGSMFEYLMPLLVMKRCESTLLDETYTSVVLAQRSYCESFGLPWGISESAYNVMDLSMTYQYRAFGVQSLGLKAGLSDDLVIAPYASALAIMTCPALALPNMRRLAKEGLEGPCGFYEAMDYTPERVPPGKKHVIVKAYMAHHTGMTLVSLGNALCDFPMQRRFHADARVKATELLLEERAPLGVPALAERVIQGPPQAVADEQLSHVERFALDELDGQRAHLLGHGELATLLTARGAGFITWRSLDVHRYRDDVQSGGAGVFLYVQNRKTGDFWSLGHEPVRRAADEYFIEFAPDKVRIQRRDGDIESSVKVVVSPEYPAELRSITLFNHGSESVELDLTSYMEVVLAPRAADLAHRAFSNMFVHTEGLPERGGVLATRTPRKSGDFQPWCLQMLTPETGSHGSAAELPFEFETSRTRFLGRGRSYDAPLALVQSAPLSGTQGEVLDPVIALRRTVRLGAGERINLTLTTALGDSRSSVLSVADALSTSSGVTRTFELAWADARVELKHLGISGLVSHRFQRLLSALLFPEPALRGSNEPVEPGSSGTQVLWSQGISGDLPILLVRLDDTELGEVVRDVLLAHEFFRLNNVQIDLVLWNEEPAGYFSPVNDKALQLVRGTAAQGRLDQRGGVFLRQAHRLTPRERALVLASARVVLSASQGSLARQLRRAEKTAQTVERTGKLPTRAALLGATERHDALAFDNGYGGFSEDGREYVLHVSAEARPPLPWCNVLAGPGFGTLISESGGGFTWSGNSQRHRLTPWSNDSVLDVPGEVLYLRDESDGSVWSATPSPLPAAATYSVRHGQGYSVFERPDATWNTHLTLFVDPDGGAKIHHLRVENRTKSARKLSAFMFVDWVLGSTREQTQHTVATHFLPEAQAILAENPFSGSAERCAFLVSTRALMSVTGNRQEFLDASGSRALPAALAHRCLSGEVGRALAPCAVLHVELEVPPGQSEVLSFVLGDAASRKQAHEHAARYARQTDVGHLLERARGLWDDILECVQVETPDPSLDVMLNRWLLYQTLSCRIWGRSAFYQSGGAYGFRDQLQDVLALLHARPQIAREHILRAAARQFTEGDVQHWWHPETGEGVRTHCSDDMLWLPFATLHYVRVTGDESILEEKAPFLTERALHSDEHDLYGVPRVSDEVASLYEHCKRALHAGTTYGPHGMPLMRGGDWNDGMDRVGAGNVGESVWLGWFLAAVWRDFAELARARGDHATAEFGRAELSRLSEAIDGHAWDGSWYRRAFADDGSLLGSAENSECRIDAIAQSWSELSGIADARRARSAVQSSLNQLVHENPGMMQLLTPPFTRKNPHDPGYIRAYPPGIRENGGQYTHGVLWTVQALARQGESERAYSLLSLLNPVHHGATRHAVERYQVEPYVVAADVYASPEHFGRGGWTWYTGAAGWMYRIALEDILGVQVRGKYLSLMPRVPASWQHYSVRYRRDDTTLHIEVTNPHGIELAESELYTTLDDQPVPAQRIPFPQDGGEHMVRLQVRPARASREHAG